MSQKRILSLFLSLSLAATAAALPAQSVLTNGEPDPGHPDLHAWFDAGVGINGIGQPSNGDPVWAWADRSDHHHDLVQVSANASEQPTWLASEVNFHPALQFDGDDAIWGDEVSEFGTITEARTIFVVARVAAGNDAVYLFDGHKAAGRNGLLTGQNGYFPGRWQIWTGTNAVVGTDVGYEQYQIHSIYLEQGFQQHYINGVLQASGTLAVSSLRGLTVGARYTLEDFFEGGVGELLFYSAALSQDDREDLESYLMDKYLRPRPVLSCDPLLPGEVISVYADGCTPDGVVVFAYSVQGAGPVSTTWGTVMLTPPVYLLPPNRADANGHAYQTAKVPASVSEKPIWFQALDHESGALSNLLIETVL